MSSHPDEEEAERIVRSLIGRTIVGVELNPSTIKGYHGGRDWSMYDPVFVLDNGARVSFRVTETINQSDFGVLPVIAPP